MNIFYSKLDNKWVRKKYDYEFAWRSFYWNRFCVIGNLIKSYEFYDMKFNL